MQLDLNSDGVAKNAANYRHLFYFATAPFTPSGDKTTTVTCLSSKRSVSKKHIQLLCKPHIQSHQQQTDNWCGKQTTIFIYHEITSNHSECTFLKLDDILDTSRNAVNLIITVINPVENFKRERIFISILDQMIVLSNLTMIIKREPSC